VYSSTSHHSHQAVGDEADLILACIGEGLQNQNLMGKILPSWGTGTHGVCGKRFAIGRLQNAVGDADDQVVLPRQKTTAVILISLD
jgi:hypothetical protein